MIPLRVHNWLQILLGILFCAALLPPFSGDPHAQVERSPLKTSANEAWARIVPEVNMFWKEREETPFIAKKSAWRIIRMLKDYIVKYPGSDHIPEAYYLVGVAYREVGFTPEAISHWRIVAKEFPNSKWADEALMEILTLYDELGEVKKKRQLLKEIIRQYPDTASAKAAWVSLALEAVVKGKDIPFIEHEVERLERAEPDISAKIPVFLELKARLALAKGNKKEAINYWLHFLNLTPTKAKQALALYEIGEIYRGLGDYIRARKYYALCARDYSRTSYALFARFRLAQIHERELGIVPWAKDRAKEEESSAWLYNKILKEFPRHTITQEVIYEYAKLKIRRQDLSGALKLIEFYFKTNPSGRMRDEFLALSHKLQKKMLRLVESPNYIETNLKACLDLLEDPLLRVAIPGYAQTAKALWQRLIRVYVQKGEFQRAINEANSMTHRFPKDLDLKHYSDQMRAEALWGLLSRLFSEKRYLDLLDYFFSKKGAFSDVVSRQHLYLVARSWDQLGLKSEASYFYGMALVTPGKGPEERLILMDWGRTVAASGDYESMGEILETFEEISEQGSRPPLFYHLRSVLEQRNKRWDKAYEYATRGLEIATAKGDRRPLLEDMIFSAIHLSLWDTARDAYRELEGYLSPQEQFSLLDRWADTAYSLGAYEEAFLLYNMILTNRPSDGMIQMKMALALMKEGKGDEAEGLLQTVAIGKDRFLSSYAEALLENNSFLNKIPKELRVGKK